MIFKFDNVLFQTIETVNWIVKQLSRGGYSFCALTGDMEMNERMRQIGQFRRSSKMLITTNIVSRGVDFSAVRVVINFDIPLDRNGSPNFKSYLHRLGRAGRFG